MVKVEIRVDDQGLEKALLSKGNEVEKRGRQLLRDLLDVAQRWVQSEAPRKTGRLKSSVKKQSSGSGGYVFVSKNIAPYAFWVIDGTRPHTIIPKNGKALSWPGAKHPVKKVRHPGTKPNPFVDKAAQKMMSDIEKKVKIFEDWLVDV